MSFIRFEPPRPLHSSVKAKLAKKLEEKCFKPSPDSKYNCCLVYEGDPAGRDHLHTTVDENGLKVAEWFDHDMTEGAAEVC